MLKIFRNIANTKNIAKLNCISFDNCVYCHYNFRLKLFLDEFRIGILYFAQTIKGAYSLLYCFVLFHKKKIIIFVLVMFLLFVSCISIFILFQ